ncbi:TetR/AcrR family transcriptional regulator [Microbacterium sp. P01]|uniref:TetR/AcrR family transcriptional regulator n=1 Tax=unclassified Microbacterium TaxID=2609290 RepID=UPI0036711310
MRSHILETARRLTLEHGLVPSLNAVAEAANVSKGGLMHHFPTRSSLVVGLARQALDEVDVAMSAAAARGTAARTWLQLSLPEGDERALMRAMASSFQPTDDDFTLLLTDSASAIARWESLIAAEVGDATQAHVIRLIGDALVGNALVGLDSPNEDVEELLGFVTAGRVARSSNGR